MESDGIFDFTFVQKQYDIISNPSINCRNNRIPQGLASNKIIFIYVKYSASNFKLMYNYLTQQCLYCKEDTVDCLRLVCLFEQEEIVN